MPLSEYQYNNTTHITYICTLHDQLIRNVQNITIVQNLSLCAGLTYDGSNIIENELRGTLFMAVISKDG